MISIEKASYILKNRSCNECDVSNSDWSCSECDEALSIALKGLELLEKKEGRAKVTVGEEAEYIVKYTGEALQLLPDIMQKLVRCKDCKYWSGQSIDGYYLCTRWKNQIKNFATKGNWFCADGEPKDGEQE